MKLTLILAVGIILTAITAKPAESTVWNTGANSVTYSDSITGMALESPTQTFNLSQFNSADAATAEGAAGQYSLTKVVLSLDGSIAGAVKFDNESTSPSSSVEIWMTDNNHPEEKAGGWTQVSFGGLSTLESFNDRETFTDIAADNEADNGDADFVGTDSGTHTVANEGYGASMSESTTSLTAFEGDGTLAAEVDFHGTWVASDLPNSLVSISVFGESDVSVTYYYDFTPVPEPTSAFLLGIGILFLSLRRKIGGKISCTAKC